MVELPMITVPVLFVTARVKLLVLSAMVQEKIDGEAAKDVKDNAKND
jgi:hypothetical protein|tara:strand:- start:467 stop:607 length:141 start_codon:yes stop_codon:yes gene_type:complete